MATIVRKRIKGRLYFYAVQTQWIDGRSRTVWQKYLGKAEDIIKAVQGATPPAPHEAVVFEFGAVAALYSLAERLQLVDTINAHVTKREQGFTVGEYMLIATLNRAISPTSKRQIGEWFGGTSLRRWIPIRPDRLTSQRFWDHMGYLGEEEIRAIEADLVARLVREFNVDLRAMLYDATNFFTYISTA